MLRMGNSKMGEAVDAYSGHLGSLGKVVGGVGDIGAGEGCEHSD